MLFHFFSSSFLPFPTFRQSEDDFPQWSRLFLEVQCNFCMQTSSQFTYRREAICKKSNVTNAGLKRSDWSKFKHVLILLSKKQGIYIFFSFRKNTVSVAKARKRWQNTSSWVIHLMKRAASQILFLNGLWSSFVLWVTEWVSLAEALVGKIIVKIIFLEHER